MTRPYFRDPGKPVKFTVDNHSNKVRIRFSYKGERFLLPTAIRYDEDGIQKIQHILTQIQQDLSNDSFDVTLSKYRDMVLASKNVLVVDDGEPAFDLYELFKEFIKYKQNRQEIPK